MNGLFRITGPQEGRERAKCLIRPDRWLGSRSAMCLLGSKHALCVPETDEVPSVSDYSTDTSRSVPSVWPWFVAVS
jgi:hypothetical protein